MRYQVVILLVILIAVFVPAFAKDENHKWAIGLNFSSGLSGCFAQAEVPITYFKHSPFYGLNTNLFVQRRVGRWGASIGLGYNFFQYDRVFETKRAIFPDPTPSFEFQMIERAMLHYFSFPLRVDFYILDKSIQLYAFAAIEPSFNIFAQRNIRFIFPEVAATVDPAFINGTNTTYDDTYINTYSNDGSTQRIRNYALFNMNAVAGMGLWGSR